MTKRILERNRNTLLMGTLVAGIFLVPQGGARAPVVVIGTWLVVCFLTEVLWHRTLDGSAVVTMSPAAHLATLAVLPVPWALGVIFVSGVTGSMVWRRWRIVPSLEYGLAVLAGAAAALTVLLLSGVFLSLRAPAEGVVHVIRRPEHLTWLLASGLAYQLVVQGLISFRSGRRRGVSTLTAWLQSFGYQTEIVSSVALIVVGILALFCFDVLGHQGILLTVMPILFVRDGSRRYIELATAQRKLIENERLAAKGEMAAEIGHELNNYLAAISGRAQLLLRSLGPETGERQLAEEAGRVQKLSALMAELAKGLMDFSRQEVQRTAYGINDLVEKTVDFVRPQNRFRDVRFDLGLDPNLPSVEMDPGEIQQVLLTLLGRAASRVNRDGTRSDLAIVTFADARRNSIGIEIRLPADAEPETGVDTDAEPDLGLVNRILDRHHGRLERLREEGNGEAYRVVLLAA